MPRVLSNMILLVLVPPVFLMNSDGFQSPAFLFLFVPEGRIEM